MTLCDDRFLFIFFNLHTRVPSDSYFITVSAPRTQERKSGSTHSYRAGALNYCMTLGSVTSNLQVVNTVQHQDPRWYLGVCSLFEGGERSNSGLFLETHINTSAAEPLLLLSELCSARTEDDKQDHTQNSLHGRVTMAHSINTTIPPTPPASYLSSPIHTHTHTHTQDTTLQSM